MATMEITTPATAMPQATAGAGRHLDVVERQTRQDQGDDRDQGAGDEGDDGRREPGHGGALDLPGRPRLTGDHRVGQVPLLRAVSRAHDFPAASMSAYASSAGREADYTLGGWGLPASVMAVRTFVRASSTVPSPNRISSEMIAMR